MSGAAQRPGRDAPGTSPGSDAPGTSPGSDAPGTSPGSDAQRVRVRLDRDARRLDARHLVGGRPARVVRLSERGAAALDALLVAGDVAAAERRAPGAAQLAARLVRAGALQPDPPPDPAAAGGVTAVVPVRDRAGLLGPLVAALDGVAEVVVVDDGSTDGSAAAAERAGARVLRRATPGGPAAARNLGLRAAGTEVVAFLDSDCVPCPGWLERLAGHLADPAVAVVAPRIVAAGASGSAVARYEAARSALDMGPAAAEVRPGSRVSYVPAAALLVRRAAVLEAGGFDETLRYGEDVDLIWRLSAEGHAIRYEPRAQVAHHHPATVRELLVRRHGYGRAAAPLAASHPDALVAAELSGWGLALLAGVAVGNPRVVAAAAAGSAVSVAWHVGSAVAGDRLSRPRAALGVLPAAAGLAAAGQLAAARQVAEACTRTWLPLTAAAAVAAPRGARARLAAALAAALLAEHRERGAAVDPLRYAALRLAEDAAYCAGVWRGCASDCTATPLRLRIRRPAGRTTPRPQRLGDPVRRG